MKRVLVFLSVIPLSVMLFGCGGTSPNVSSSVADVPVSTESATEVDTVPETEQETEPETETETIDIEIIGGEENEYFKVLTLNADTEFPDERYAYFLPPGNYTVENIGEYMVQIDVYEEEMYINEDGWEEAKGTVFGVIDSGKSVEITINDGEYLEVESGERLHVVSSVKEAE